MGLAPATLAWAFTSGRLNFQRAGVEHKSVAEVMKRIFTSESVTEGHPDKMADQISDAVLDAVLRDDPMGRVACEVLVTTGICVVAGEITTKTYVDVPDLARQVIKDIGFDDATFGYDGNTCGVLNVIQRQSRTKSMSKKLRTLQFSIRLKRFFYFLNQLLKY